MARMPSPPGRFSTTIGCFHCADSLSANSRAPMSTPLAAPKVTMKRTGRVGRSTASVGRRTEISVAAAKNHAPKRAQRTRITESSPTRSCLHVEHRGIAVGSMSKALFASGGRQCYHYLGVRRHDLMPHVLFSPLLKWGFAAVGGAMVVQWVVAEVRRGDGEQDARPGRGAFH